MDVHPTKNVSIGIDPHPYTLEYYGKYVNCLPSQEWHKHGMMIRDDPPFF